MSLAKISLAAAATVGALVAVAPAAHADETCQTVDPVTACVATVGDPTTGSFGVGVHAGPVNLCLVVLATCP